MFIKNKIESEESAINFLNSIFNKLENPTTENYYDLANFFKDFKKIFDQDGVIVCKLNKDV